MSTFNEDRFRKFWIEKSKELRNLELDENQAQTISRAFKDELLTFFGEVTKIQEMNECMSEVHLALQSAFSNYRRANKNFWGLVFGRFTGPALDLSSKMLK